MIERLEEGTEPVSARRARGVPTVFARATPDGLEVLEPGTAVRTATGEGAGELAEVLRGAVVVVPRREPFLRALGGRGVAVAAEVVVGLDDLAAWLSPGGLGSDLERLLTQRAGVRGGLDDAAPLALERATRALVAEIQSLPLASLGCIARSWEEAGARLAASAPEVARRLTLLARLVDRPSGWAGAGESVLGADVDVVDGRLVGARGEFGDLDMALAEASPPWAEDPQGAPIPPDHKDVVPLDDADRDRVERALAEVLPNMGGGRTARGRPMSARPAQVDVAKHVAASLGTGELLLLHAPTGTGKTLAYLVPGLLFAQRNGIRFGFATFTKALQRQAFDRDLPIALELLQRTGVDPLPKVAVLKGRANYVCWRALLSLAPGPADGAARWLAWCNLLAFSLTSPDGDLDRVPRNGIDPFADVDGVEVEWELLRRSLGARTSCCNRPGDRLRCAAEAARKKAERSHGVVTNHAFALARPEFFRHVVFDECEHLHDQAHGAFSRSVSLSRAKRLLDDLSGSRRGRGVLDTLRRSVSGMLAFGSAESELDRAFQARTRGSRALTRLGSACREFARWRRERQHERRDGDDHGLLREYVESGVDGERGDAGLEQAEKLLSGHGELCRALQELSVALGALSEGLFEVRVPRRERIRFQLDDTRTDVEELLDAIAPWLPLKEGALAFDRGTFYDVEERPDGDLALETRVLLPHEYLGRFHYPKLAGGVLLSATTLLRGGFEDARRYLGLARAAAPDEDEEREPVRVSDHAAPESFDYGRVRVFAPDDVPDYRSDKRGWLEHGARLVAHLAARTGGRTLALYTNLDDLARVGATIAPFLAEHGVETLVQGAQGWSAERLADRFRTHGRAVLLGVDSFWFGADFPGEALEYLVIAKLPYGVPDRYHHAQCAAMGREEQRRTIYQPRALARFRQGFGRLMRRVDDRGCVFVLDRRFTEPRHKAFGRELPLASADGERTGARCTRTSTDDSIREALRHMGIEERVRAEGLDTDFSETWL
ncbi:MAG: helicase C-terminal domain-containing protein [Planctomycetota bacterium]